ncbi:5473_t:CDS:2, partial [Cetraspora pellucida]
MNFVEVKIDEESEVKEDKKKLENNYNEKKPEDKMPSKYFAISSEDDCVVKFILKKDFEFKLQIYTIEKLHNKKGDLELKDNLKSENNIYLEDDKKTLYRKLS